jgi:hypothetical protein
MILLFRWHRALAAASQRRGKRHEIFFRETTL